MRMILHKHFLTGWIGRWLSISLLLLSIPNLSFAQQKKVQKEYRLMGTKFEFVLVLNPTQIDSAEIYFETARAEVQRVENLISSWKDGSETDRVNRNAGLSPTMVSQELFQLINRGLKVSKLTEGAFDLSFAGMDRLWKFDGSMSVLPDSISVAKSKRNVDFRAIELDPKNSTVFLKKKRMKIGFGAIGKGYAANRIRNLMMDAGIVGGVIDAGGDLIMWGKNEDGNPWKVGIRKPGAEEKPIGYIEVTDMAVVTSGNYERFATINGKRYAHIIDPRTGYPAVGLKSVTIVCPDAELADALATSVFVMGKEAGLYLVEQMSDIECAVIDDEDHIFTTSGIALLHE